MENLFKEKRGLLISLVIVTVVIFILLVYLIATRLPINVFGFNKSNQTTEAPIAETNCTRPITFWRDHSELYPSQVVIAGQVYKAKDMGRILADESGDLALKLQAQLMVAYLNVLSGANQSYIAATIFEAYGWLVEHPTGSEITDSAREEGTRFYDVLESFNQGLAGVLACESTSSSGLTKTRTIIMTSADLTTTLYPIFTPTVSEAPFLTDTPARATNTVIKPSQTAVQATITPIIRSPTVTKTLVPTASFTPVNTTAAPTPTDTSTPEATPTFPSSPTPSPTFPPTLPPF